MWPWHQWSDKPFGNGQFHNGSQTDGAAWAPYGGTQTHNESGYWKRVPASLAAKGAFRVVEDFPRRTEEFFPYTTLRRICSRWCHSCSRWSAPYLEWNPIVAVQLLPFPFERGRTIFEQMFTISLFSCIRVRAVTEHIRYIITIIVTKVTHKIKIRLQDSLFLEVDLIYVHVIKYISNDLEYIFSMLQLKKTATLSIM